MPTRGLLADKQERAERAAGQGPGGKRNWIRELRLTGPGETAKFRLLTEGDNFCFEWFHRVQDTLQSGATIWRRIVCPRQIGSPCQRCQEKDFAGKQFLAWAFVYSIDYPEAPQSDKIETELIKNERGQAVYRQTVNAVRLIAMSGGHAEGFTFRFERNGTLLDRDYELIRQSERRAKKPTYLLEPFDQSAMTPELKDTMSTLPDLEDVAYGRVSDLGGAVEETPAEGQADAVPVDVTVAEPDFGDAAEGGDDSDPDPEF